MAVANGSAIHAQTMRVPAPDLARELLEHLGPTVVAALAGARDRKQPYKWASHGAQPRQESVTRLQVAYRVWSTIADADGPNVARAWFIGANPRFGERPPYLAIREGLFGDVVAAAEEFVDHR